ncbi:MAG: hypothetical protein LBE12_18350 [Planctomycetaceae bacterium]|jgi:hypothetical protein|nr:hypothetical protein [Planctomycetaceae bacterium]
MVVPSRFNRLDPFFGNVNDPQSFHKYLYTHADPINRIDPTELESLGSLSVVYVVNIGGMDMYVIAESKGDKSKLSKSTAKGDQMYKDWIDSSIQKLENKKFH